MLKAGGKRKAALIFTVHKNPPFSNAKDEYLKILAKNDSLTYKI